MNDDQIKTILNNIHQHCTGRTISDELAQKYTDEIKAKRTTLLTDISYFPFGSSHTLPQNTVVEEVTICIDRLNFLAITFNPKSDLTYET